MNLLNSDNIVNFLILLAVCSFARLLVGSFASSLFLNIERFLCMQINESCQQPVLFYWVRAHGFQCLYFICWWMAWLFGNVFNISKLLTNSFHFGSFWLAHLRWVFSNRIHPYWLQCNSPIAIYVTFGFICVSA